MTNFGKKMLSFFAVFFLTLCIFGCNMSPEVGDREGLKEAKENVKWLLTNFNFGEVINDNVKDPVIGNVGIAEDLDGKVSENDWRNGSYSEFMYGMSASFESSNPEIMDAKWNIYKKRAYVYGDPANPDKITGIETKETKALEFVVNRPAPDQEDVTVDITIKVKAPYQIGEQTYYHEGTRTVTFTVLKQPVSNTMTVGELEDYVLANWDAFNNGSLFKDENGNVLNVSIEGIVTEQVWGDGYDNHSFTMADDQGNAIYVYGPQNPVNIGDRVIVTGQPAYYNGTIQIGLKSTVEIVKEASEYVAAEKTTIEEWYAKYPTQNTDHKIPGHRVKVSGLFIQKTVDGYTNYAIQSTESDHFIQIYYKSYGAYEEQLLKEMLGKAAEFELAMYYCHNNGYWVGILNNYDYQPKLIEMSQEDKLAADVAGIKATQTVKNGEKVELPTGTLANGTVLSGWTVDKEGYINLETLVADLGNAKEDVKVTLTATATNGAASQEVKVEVTIKYVKAEIAEKTVKELIDLQEEMLETFKVTGTVVQWGNKLDTPADAPTKYGNFVLEGEDGSRIIVYGATATESALQWDGTAGKYKYTNAQDFLTNELTSQIKLGDKVQLLVVRTSYNGNPQLNAVVLALNPEQGETPEPTFGVVNEIKENVAYKLGFAHLNASLAGKEYFLTGEMDGYYGATVEDHTKAADIYFIAVEGGYQIKLVKADGAVKYVNAVASGTHTNIQFADSATSVWTLDTELNTLVTTVGSGQFLLGTRSDKTYTTIGPVAMTYASTTCIVHVYGGSVVTPEPPVHEHEFVNGECACGEKDPNYIPPVVEPTFGVVSEIKENVAYKLGFAHLNASLAGKEYFLTGEMDGYYGATVVDHTKAADIYFIVVEGGYQIKLVKADGTVKYVNAVASGTHTNIQFADSATSVWTLDTELNTLVTTVGSGQFLLGTRSDKTYTTIGPVAMTYASTTCIVHVYGESVVTPEPPVHEHEFVNGECACGEKDPNYVPPVVGQDETITVALGDYAAANGWSNGVMYNTMNLNEKVTATLIAEGGSGSYGANTGKYYTSGTTWRMYQSDKNATLTITANGANIKSVKVTYTASNNGTLVFGGANIASETVVEVNGSEIVFTIANTGSATNGQVRITAIEVVCGSASGETPEPPVHEHEFVNGECACGEKDPNYVAPEIKEPEVTNKTVAELIALATEMDASYKVTGKVVLWGNSLTSTATTPVKYGNFVLEGEDGSKIVVYGATATASALVWNSTTGKYTYTNAQDFLTNATTSAIALGDTVELLVVRTSYNGNPQLNAIVLKVTPATPEHEHVFVEGKCECGAEDPNYVAPEVSANKADLDTMGAKNSSYSDRTSKSGWTATYAALNCGGTTNMNPQFIVFGTENDFALTITGGTDMVGKITSPVLNNGLSKLSFNYTKLFTDTTLSVTVYVKDVEGNVLYSEVITYAAEKNEKYVLKTYELVLETPIQGDFVIEIVNNCPTGVTGKKDRISIWNITWENAPVKEEVAEPQVETYTMVGPNAVQAADGKSATWDTGNFIFLVTQGTATNAMRLTDTDHFRVYAKFTFDINGKNGETMTEVVITFKTESYATACVNSLTTEGVTAVQDGTTVTFSGEGFKTLSFVASAQFRVMDFTITYTK